MKISIRLATIVGLTLAAGSTVLAQGNSRATVQIPTGAGFNVNNVSAVTTATPAPFSIRLTDIRLSSPNRSVRVSVRAAAPDFTPPNGPAMPSSLVFWSTSNPQNCTGINGTLTDTSFTPVLDTIKNPKTASVDVTWRLAAPGPSIRAGTHSLTVVWRIESF